MGIPFKKIGSIALQAAGVAVGNKTEKRENEILEEILAQQQLTNAILFKALEEEYGGPVLKELTDELEND